MLASHMGDKSISNNICSSIFSGGAQAGAKKHHAQTYQAVNRRGQAATVLRGQRNR